MFKEGLHNTIKFGSICIHIQYRVHIPLYVLRQIPCAKETVNLSNTVDN
jgi:hypothetical protein